MTMIEIVNLLKNFVNCYKFYQQMLSEIKQNLLVKYELQNDCRNICHFVIIEDCNLLNICNALGIISTLFFQMLNKNRCSRAL